MSSNVCRLCNSTNTKLTTTTSDKIVEKFLDFIPSLGISSSTKLPTAVCQLCFGKAKITCDFIEKIQTVQKEFEGNFKRSWKSLTPAQSATEEALKKVQQRSGIKVTKVSSFRDFEVVDELGSFDAIDDSDEDFKVEPKMEMIESDDEYVEEAEQDSDDDEYVPVKSKRRSGDGKVKQEKKGGREKEEVREIIIDAPISFTCAKCGAKFPDLELLTVHMKARNCFTQEAPTCGECGKVFSTKKTLYSHMATHREKKDRIMCEMCAKTFAHSYDLESHMESVHRRVVRRDCIYKCTHCPDSFNSQMDLLDHVREHQRQKKEAPRMCEFCGKECKNQKSYQNHLITHKETKPHHCNVCGKGFSKHFLLVQHMHIHTGIKSYVCDICNKSYAKRDSLRIHKKRDHPDHMLG